MPGFHPAGVHHAYGTTQVLGNICLIFRVGEPVCLLRPSGCGKTTLLRIAVEFEQLKYSFGLPANCSGTGRRSCVLRISFIVKGKQPA